MANLPISVFAEKRLCYERAHPHDPPPTVVGFTLVDPDPAVDASAWPLRNRNIVSYLARVAETALAGSQSVATSLIEDVVIVRLQTDMQLLGFDAQAEQFKAAHASGKACADEQLRAALQTKPDRVRGELERLNVLVLAELNRQRGGAPPRTQLRSRLIEPFGQRSLRVTHSFGLGADTDDRLVLDRQGLGPGEAFRARDTRLRSFPLSASDQPLDLMTKYERALTRGSMRTLLAIPLFSDVGAWGLAPAERPKPAGVVTFDSDDDLSADFAPPDLMRWLVSETALLYPAL